MILIYNTVHKYKGYVIRVYRITNKYASDVFSITSYINYPRVQILIRMVLQEEFRYTELKSSCALLACGIILYKKL